MGVSDDPPGETFWKVANGIRLTGMPEFNEILTTTQIWQVSLLLANADKPLPPAALQIVRGDRRRRARRPRLRRRKAAQKSKRVAEFRAVAEIREERRSMSVLIS